MAPMAVTKTCYQADRTTDGDPRSPIYSAFASSRHGGSFNVNT